MIAHPVIRQQRLWKSSVVSQRVGLSHQPIFEYKRPSDVHDLTVIQLTWPMKMPSVGGPGLL